MASFVNNPLFDTSSGDFTDINNPKHRHLFAANNELQPANNDKSSPQHIRQQMDDPESGEIDGSNTEIKSQIDPQTNPQNTSNTDKTNKEIDPNINDDEIPDLDDILEQQMEDASIQRQQELEIKVKAENHGYNLLKLYIFVLIFALIVAILVSNWGRTKLIQYAHRFGIDQLCVRMTDIIYRYCPLLGSINANDDEISINVHSISSNKPNPRKKLHIKDPSEGEKLISGSNVNDNNRTKKELFEPRLFGGESSILTSSYKQLLHSWLAIRYNWLDWKLLYNLNVDGSSMLTFYDKCNNKGSLIMIIKDERGYIFGVFIGESDGLNNKGNTTKFFGGADTFVFTLYPNANKYEWTKKNRFFVYFDLKNNNNQSITIGGGKYPAITLLANLSKGISQKSDTFNNPQLSSKQQFNCISLEVWSLIDYQ